MILPDYAYPNVDRIEAVHVISELLASTFSAGLVVCVWWWLA